MNTSSLTGLVVVIAAAIWLGAFVPAWAKRGEKSSMVREATRQIKRQARALAPKRSERATKRVDVVAPSRVNYQALYQAAVQVASDYEASKAEVVDERAWTPRTLPAPMHAGHIGTLEQPVLAEVTKLQQPVIPAAAVNPEQVITGQNLDEILRRRRAV
jgi:FtsZ-interacting cell division protein ZipA